MQSNSRKERPEKTTIGIEVAHIKYDTNNTFKVKISLHSSLEFIISTPYKNVRTPFVLYGVTNSCVQDDLVEKIVSPPGETHL